jgi:hypothetical protein
VPLLVLANKNDLPGAMGVDELIREMRLGEIRERVVSVSPHVTKHCEWTQYIWSMADTDIVLFYK